MLALTILSVFVLIVFLLIFIEYRNEKKYQAARRKQRQQHTPPEKTTVLDTSTQPEVKPEPEPEPEPKIEPKIEVKPEPKKLPEGNYPPFTHIRLLEMGLSDEEAKEFVHELIPQIETQIPLIQLATQELDFHKIERLTHSIKGSATNLGTGGVSDLLVEYNTYLKTGTDIDIAKAYFDHLVRYNNQLKAQYT